MVLRRSSLLRPCAATLVLLVGSARQARADDPPFDRPMNEDGDDAVPSETTAEAPPPIPVQPTPGREPAPFSPSDLTTNETGKRIGVGVDVLFLLPIAELGDTTGPLAGPVFRFGYRVVPLVEVALRGGYLFGTYKGVEGVRSKVDILPLWIGARVFFYRPFVGPYAALEVGMNSLLPGIEPPPTTQTANRLTELRRRFGGNLAVGWLLSQNLPFDVRAQVMFLNLIGRSGDLNEGLNTSVSLSVGYTLQF